MVKNDRRSKMKYLFMARSAKEGKQYLKEHDSELKAFGKMGYAVVGLGGYFMIDEASEPEKVAFFLIVKDYCLDCCKSTDRCMSETVAEGCLKVEGMKDGIVAYEPSSRNVEYYG